MSRRFGRTRARRLRSELATAQQKAKSSKEDATYSRFRLYELEDRVRHWDDELRRLLGEYSAFLFETGKMSVQTIDRYGLRIPIVDSMDGLLSWQEMQQDVMRQITMTSIKLQNFLIDTRREDFGFNRLMRIRLQDSKEIVYSVSEEMVRSGTLGRRDYEEIGMMAARQLIDAVNQDAKGRR